jgi:hypothetical protein
MDHMADLRLVFQEASVLCSRVVVAAYISTSSAQGFLIPSSSPTPVIGGGFDGGYSNRGEVES